MTFVSNVCCPLTEQVLNKTFDHWPAVATRAGEMNPVRGALSVLTWLIEDPADLDLGGRRREGFYHPWDAHCQNPTAMQRCTQRRVIKGQIASQRMDGRFASRRDLRTSVLHFVDQGQHIAGIRGISYREMHGEGEARGYLGDHTGFFAKLRGTVALAFENRRNGDIIGIDDFAMGQRRAMREASGLFFNPLMALHSVLELRGLAPLYVRKRHLSVQVLLGCLCQGQDVLPHLKQMLFDLVYQLRKHFTLPAALPAKPAHELLEDVLEAVSLGLQRRGPGRSLVGKVRDDLEDFFGALYSVAASLTRGLPCSLGNVSTTRCVGLTRPASIAAVAWMLSSSSIKASSRRPRNWAKTSGSTKCPCARSTWTTVMPQAYITAKSVRNRLQSCSSEQDNSCFSNSKANNTHVAMDARPRVVWVGNRWATLRSTTATTAAHGNVSGQPMLKVA